LGGKSNSNSIFSKNCYGILSNRDQWVWNFNKYKVIENTRITIEFYNQQRLDYQINLSKGINVSVEDFITYDETKITWDKRKMRGGIENNKELFHVPSCCRIGLYRPYCKHSFYFSKELSHSLFIQPLFFPNDETNNYIITIPNMCDKDKFTPLISSKFVDLHFNGDSQCFPLYYYEENTSNQEGMFGEDAGPQHTRKDAISDFIYEKALQQYGLSKTGSGTITKEDIFYYVYGFLHSPEYRETFANDLKKMLPRIPLVDSINDFWAFSKAGRALADLHINYESIAPYPDCIVTGAESSFFTVEKMRFPKKGQKDTINYNSKITISKIPEKAYEYVVNGKSAIEWIMERYQITTHKDSGITNNPNDWSEEVGNPRYILDLLLSIINVSVQTVDIVNGLPKVKFEE
jgi:predicted helicase